MIFIQWVMVAVIFLLLFNKDSVNSAVILLVTYLVYELFVVDLNGWSYYSLTAALNFMAGYALTHVNAKAAICSYVLVFCNLIGFVMWAQYYEPSLYNSMSLSVLTVQILMILPKGLINGLGNNIKRVVFDNCIADFFKANTKDSENLQNKKAIK